MTFRPYPNSSVAQRFFAPLAVAYALSSKKYDCTGISDIDHLKFGVTRVLSDSKTGRDFVQRQGDFGFREIGLDHLSKTLKSDRRLTNQKSANLALADAMTARCDDPFAGVPGLDKFAIYAGDGHYHSAAARDAPLESGAGEMKRYPTGHFFMLDLRSHHARHIATAEQGGTRKAEHDMRVIKRIGAQNLRCGAPKGTKVIIAWDPAGIDFEFWRHAKGSHGLYFISLEKANMNLRVVGTRDFDADAPENAGIVSDEIVVPASGKGRFRRVVYVNAVDGTRYTYITTEMTLEPWVIVLIYKHRWDIEKVFDEFKSKLYERQSWASGETAKSAHATFLCLAHNLMVLFEEEIEREEGVVNWKEAERKAKRAEEAREKGASYIELAIQRFTVRPLKFIRWVRNFIYQEGSWEIAMARLTRIYATL
jgi:hypothetical protein